MAPINGIQLGLGVALAVSALACGGPSRPPSFILVSLDTVRADHLGVYGYERNTTPFLDELAERAFVFEQAIAPSQNTLISHASLVTGLFPVAHGATHRDGGRAIAPAFNTLAEDLAAHGYRTAAFLAHADWLNARFGFKQGFEVFTSKYRSANAVLRQAEEWLSERSPDSPFFLFLHLYDAHSDWADRPYDAPEPFRGKFATREIDIKGMKGSDYLGEVNRGNIEITPAEVEVVRDQYDEGLAFVDHRLRVFFGSLPGDMLEQTWILIVADHGEGFMEHGRMLHTSLHDEVVRIPFLVIPPAGSDGFRETPVRPVRPVRIAEQVRLVDVRPTILSLAGIPRPTDAEGVDLVPCLRNADECRSHAATLHDDSLRFQGYKLLRQQDVTYLYDLERDPGERTDLANHPEMQERLGNLTSLLGHLVSEQGAMHERILQGADAPLVETDPEAEERLKALGYLQ